MTPSLAATLLRALEAASGRELIEIVREAGEAGLEAALTVSRREQAIAILRAAPNSSPASLSDSLMGEVFTLMVEDFAETYKCMRGHQIDPLYAIALRNDILCTLASLAALSTPNQET